MIFVTKIARHQNSKFSLTFVNKIVPFVFINPKCTKYRRGVNDSKPKNIVINWWQLESVFKIVVRTHTPANLLNREHNNRQTEIHEQSYFLHLEYRTFEVTGSVKINMVFWLVSGLRFRSLENRSFNLCPMLSHAMYAEIFLLIDYLLLNLVSDCWVKLLMLSSFGAHVRSSSPN